MRNVLSILLFAIATLASACMPALADEPVQGKVMLTKAAPDALVIWDASPVVAAYTSVSRTPAEQAMRGLESQAMTIAAGKVTQLTSAASITVRVIYYKLGAVSPIYHAATFAGIERVFSISASCADVIKHGQEWTALLASGKIPEGLTLTITGQLPPPVQQ